MVSVVDLFARQYRIWCSLALAGLAVYWVYSRPNSFGDPFTYIVLIGGQLLLAAIFHYRRVFFLVVMISFLWAGGVFPLKAVWAAARWPVLLCAAAVGMVLWLKEERQHFGAIHLIALFCAVAALTSAVVSAFPRTAFLKAMSLFLLLMYTIGGARLSILNREWQFPRTLVDYCEVIAYVTAVCYFGVHAEIFGNPNSLGAVMGVAVVPLLLWGVLSAESDVLRRRRFFALAISIALLVFSRARAGMLCSTVTAAFFLISLKRYRLFLRVLTVGIAAVALVGIWSPDLIQTSVESVDESVIHKGHRDSGLLDSRLAPWDDTMATIREHPFFGGGFGTTQTGAEDESGASTFATSAGTTREHGNSYLALLEWVGLLGILPFLVLIGAVLLEVKAVSGYMRRTLDSSHPAIPFALVCLAGLVHAAFEDWLFAVGYYLCVFMWSMAFCLVDLTRRSVIHESVHSATTVPLWQPLVSSFAPHRVNVAGPRFPDIAGR
jgi:O-antigen ligase